jgi:RNA polymerase sigma factor (sigma-70 family)
MRLHDNSASVGERISTGVVSLHSVSSTRKRAARPHADNVWRAEITRLFEQKNTALTLFLSARLRSYSDAVEVAQEAYEWLLRNKDDPRVSNCRAPLDVFLFSVARRIASNRLSQRRNHERIHREFLRPDADLHDQAPAPEQICAMREDLAIIRRSVKELPPKCRKVFILARIKGMSVEDIAAQMNVTTRSVWRYVVRAMAHCQRRLDQADRSADTVTWLKSGRYR